MPKDKTLLLEDNVISLRTAIVIDDGDIVYFALLPRSPEAARIAPDGCLKSDSTWLYRHKMSFAREFFIKRNRFHIRRDIRPMMFRGSPNLTTLWADSGESVALLLNSEPWAFIHEDSRHGYSKGILRATAGNIWDQNLFERIFRER